MSNVHAALKRVAEVTVGSEFESQIWLVGGAVRDELLGGEPKDDFDLVTELDALRLAVLLRERGASSIEPVTYPRFGTAMVRVEGTNIEIVTARKESYEATSRKPVVQPSTLFEDARRRDFTVNTLRKNLHSHEFADPLGIGIEDLRSRVLRTPLDPVETFEDDPLRMLRAVRFRWKLGFAFAEGLDAAILATSERLKIVSEERIKEEFCKILLLGRASEALDDLMKLGLLDRFAPEFRLMVGVEQGSYHHLDVWDHTRLVVRNAGTGDLILALGCLFHDIGKPSTRSIDAAGATRFFEHEIVGEKVTRQVLQRLKFSGADIEAVASLVRNHMRLGSWSKWSDSAARRLIRDLGDQWRRLLALIEADVAALRPGLQTIDVGSIRSRLAAIESVTPATMLKCPLDGEEIMAVLGASPGPEIGRAKEHLDELVLEGRLAPNDRQGAIDALRTWRSE